MGDLCTVGYERRTVDELITTLTRAAVEVLVDVRLTPLSRKPGLSKNRIATRLYAAGIDYLHYPNATDRYGVVYSLANTETAERVYVKVFVNDPEPTVPSAFGTR